MSVKSYAGPGIGAGTGDTLVSANMYGLKRDKSERAVMTFHGHGADAYTWRMGTFGSSRMATQLAEKKFVIVSDDFGGTIPWANDVAMSDTDVVHTFATTDLNALSPNCMDVVCLMGWSMGGLTALNWLKRNASKVYRAVLWCPATNIRYFHDTSPNKAAYAPEIEAAYGGGAWASNIVGHDPSQEPLLYQGLPPTRIYHGDADTTVPLQQTIDFVNAVGDVNLRYKVVPGGNHTNLFGLVDPDDVADFLMGKVAA